MAEIHYKNNITVEEYEHLRNSVGWKTIERTQAQAGIDNSRFIAVAVDNSHAVGMVRLIGDGGYINIICDVIVRSDYQGRGIGKCMVRMVLDHIKEGLAPGHSSIVYVMSAKGKEPFYESLGFTLRPSETLGCGMTQWIEN